MEAIKVKFQGISRRLPYQNNPDGVLDELINLRHRKGRLEPVGSKTKLYNLPADGEVYDRMWVHEMDTQTNFIGQADDYDLRLFNTSNGLSTSIKAYSGIVSVEFLKRFMIVIHSGGMDRFMWKDGSYSLMVFPNRPRVWFSTETKSYIADDGGNAEEILGQYYEKVNEASRENYHTGGIWFRMAYKLYDGSYVMHSLPEYLRLGLEMTLGPGLPGIHFTGSKVSVSTPEIYLSGINTDIVVSLVIFACKNEELYQVDSDGLTDDLLAAAGSVYPINFKDMFSAVSTDFQKMPDSASWYRVHEVLLDDIINAPTGMYTSEIDMKGFYQDYATREVLPVDQFTHHTLSAELSFNYNSRLVLGKTDTKFGDYAYFPLNPYLLGLGDNLFIPPGYTQVSDYNVKFLAKLNTDQGEVYKLIDPSLGTRPVFTKDGESALIKYITVSKDLIGYPDARCTELSLLMEDGGSWYNVYSWSLKKSLNDNFSYYHDPDFSLIPDYSYTDNFCNITVAVDFSTATLVNLDTYAEEELVDANRIQISEVNNPFFFPAENSYQVGTGSITGIASNTEPLSSGQFGEYPLMVFTTKGIWAMFQGSGGVLFASIQPVNGEVASNILPVGDGVVYTTSEGIFVISGKSVAELSTLVAGEPNTDFQANANYLHYLNDSRLVQLSTQLSSVNILDYISGANMGFDKVLEELYVSNENYSYSYIYRFESKTWYKINESFRFFIRQYPNLLVFRESGAITGIINLSSETFVDYIPVLLTTQPMRLGSDAFKVIQRMVLRTIHETQVGEYAGFYYFGSSDLINWQRITGRNHIDGKKRDILLQRSGSKFKYFIVVFAAKMKQGGYIGDLDIMYQNKMINKLR